MLKNDFIIFFLFFVIIAVMVLTLVKINEFTSVLKTCSDDFAIINKCHCVPCSWKNAEQLNKASCAGYLLNNSNG